MPRPDYELNCVEELMHGLLRVPSPGVMGGTASPDQVSLSFLDVLLSRVLHTAAVLVVAVEGFVLRKKPIFRDAIIKAPNALELMLAGETNIHGGISRSHWCGRWTAFVKDPVNCTCLCFWTTPSCHL